MTHRDQGPGVHLRLPGLHPAGEIRIKRVGGEGPAVHEEKDRFAALVVAEGHILPHPDASALIVVAAGTFLAL